ncbi:MAG: YkgJ family cysteine cluster protein [Clostridia bacterium]|nr:YkgJ family cysteine cluster protein [Clostridia bacterium]
MSTKRVENGHISHSCRGCGLCCRQKNGIGVTPLDVLNISKLLRISPKDFIDKYCVVLEDVDVRISTTGLFNECVFLHQLANGTCRCDIYDSRPMACYLYPLKMRETIPYYFHWEDNPACGRTKYPVSIKSFVEVKSKGRYESELKHIQKMYAVLEKYLAYRDMSEEKMLEYLYYNDSIEEINRKLDAYLDA